MNIVLSKESIQALQQVRDQIVETEPQSKKSMTSIANVLLQGAPRWVRGTALKRIAREAIPIRRRQKMLVDSLSARLDKMNPDDANNFLVDLIERIRKASLKNPEQTEAKSVSS